jgi:DNA polymerase III subunit epsilon
VRAPRSDTQIRRHNFDGAVGPFRARADATDAAALLARFTGVRTCTTRLARTAQHGPQCPSHELSPCPAPREATAHDYAPVAQLAAEHIAGLDDSALVAAQAQIESLAADGRYEIAARLRDHTATTVEALWRGQQLAALAALPELVAARPDGAAGWQLVVVRNGQLAAAGNARRGVPPMPVVDAICAAAQVILPTSAPLGGALIEETALITRWLSGPGVRIVQAAAGYCTPVAAAGRLAQWAALARSARTAAEQLGRSDLLGEPHPPRQQLLGRTGIDGRRGSGQAVFPRRNPLSAAG